MTTHRSLSLLGGTSPSAPARDAQALVATSKDVAHVALGGLDELLGAGPRVLLEVGLDGAARFMVPHWQSPVSFTRIYPDADTPRVVARARGVPLTPGHFVAVEVRALPSGPRQIDDGIDNGFLEDGRGGVVELRATYRNANDEQVLASALVELVASAETFGAEPDDPWAELLEGQAVAMPELPDLSARARWTGAGVTVDLELRYRGSPRVVELAVLERPSSSTVELAAPRWPAAFYVDELGQPLGEPPTDYPLARASDEDRGLGLIAAVEAVGELGELGPMLARWSSHSEAAELLDVVSYSDGQGDDEAPALEGEGTTRRLLTVELGAPADGAPGFPAGCYARGVEQSGAEVLDGRTGVIPVWLAVYWRASSGSAHLRVEASAWSAVETSTSSPAWDWTIAPGWLEVGAGPGDGAVLRAWIWANSDEATWAIRDLLIVYRPSS